MEIKVIAVLLAVVFAIVTVEAQRNGWNRGGRPRQPAKLPEGDVYNWERNVSTTSVSESAFIPAGSNLVIVRSFDDALRSLNISRASILYDFSTPNPLIAIGSFGPCFVTNTTLTYQDVIDQLEARNGSSVATTAEFRLDGTSLPLPIEQVRPLFEIYPALRRACKDGRVILTTPQEDTPVSFETEDLNVMIVHGEMTIRIPRRQPRPARPTGGFIPNRFGPGPQGPNRFGPGPRGPGRKHGDDRAFGTAAPSQETTTAENPTTASS